MATTSSYRPAAGQATGQFPQQQQQQPYPSYSRHPLQPRPVPERQTRVELGQRLKERGMVLDGLVVNRFASVPVPRPGEALIQVVCSDASYTDLMVLRGHLPTYPVKRTGWPVVPGYVAVGRVVAIGVKGKSKWKGVGGAAAAAPGATSSAGGTPDNTGAGTAGHQQQQQQQTSPETAQGQAAGSLLTQPGASLASSAAGVAAGVAAAAGGGGSGAGDGGATGGSSYPVAPASDASGATPILQQPQSSQQLSHTTTTGAGGYQPSPLSRQPQQYPGAAAAGASKVLAKGRSRRDTDMMPVPSSTNVPPTTAGTSGTGVGGGGASGTMTGGQPPQLQLPGEPGQNYSQGQSQGQALAAGTADKSSGGTTAAGAAGTTHIGAPDRDTQRSLGPAIATSTAAEATGIRVGDMVLAVTQRGAMCQYLTWPLNDLVRIPADVDPARACVMGLTGLTAYQMLHRIKGYSHLLATQQAAAGTRLLIHGVTGATGTMLLLLALAAGVPSSNIWGTCSAEHLHVASAIGCGHPIDYSLAGGRGWDDVVMEQTGGAGVHLVFDHICLGGHLYRSLNCVASKRFTGNKAASVAGQHGGAGSADTASANTYTAGAAGATTAARGGQQQQYQQQQRGTAGGCVVAYGVTNATDPGTIPFARLVLATITTALHNALVWPFDGKWVQVFNFAHNRRYRPSWFKADMAYLLSLTHRGSPFAVEVDRILLGGGSSGVGAGGSAATGPTTGSAGTSSTTAAPSSHLRGTSYDLALQGGGRFSLQSGPSVLRSIASMGHHTGKQVVICDDGYWAEWGFTPPAQSGLPGQPVTGSTAAPVALPQQQQQQLLGPSAVAPGGAAGGSGSQTSTKMPASEQPGPATQMTQQPPYSSAAALAPPFPLATSSATSYYGGIEGASSKQPYYSSGLPASGGGGTTWTGLQPVQAA